MNEEKNQFTEPSDPKLDEFNEDWKKIDEIYAKRGTFERTEGGVSYLDLGLHEIKEAISISSGVLKPSPFNS